MNLNTLMELSAVAVVPVTSASGQTPELSRTKPAARILVVDDEPDIVKSLSRRLRSHGYEVATASDGHEATRLAYKMVPDIVILDIGMPCGDGHTVADRLKCNVGTMLSQIIFLTARTGDNDRQKAMLAGAFGYMTKPFSSEDLIRMIEEALHDDLF